MSTFLEFEKPVAELEGKIKELRHAADGGDVNISEELARLESKVDQVLTQTYRKLSSWQKMQVARHPNRPHFSDYVEGLFDDFIELCGRPSVRRGQGPDGRYCPVPGANGIHHRS